MAAAGTANAYIRFDGVLNGLVEYRLPWYVVGNPWNGRPYFFMYSRPGFYLDLRASN